MQNIDRLKTYNTPGVIIKDLFMPRGLKILLISLCCVVVLGMLTVFLQGNIAPKSRGIIKVSGFQDWQELGKFSYRQLYGRLGYVEQIQFGFELEEQKTVDEFLEGFLKHAAEQKDERWGYDKVGELGKRLLLKPGENLFRASSKESVIEKEVRRIFIQFGELEHAKNLDELPKRCKEKEYFFDYECIRIRVSLVAAGKWKKVTSCKKATLDQVGKKDYLVLINDSDCDHN